MVPKCFSASPKDDSKKLSNLTQSVKEDITSMTIWEAALAQLVTEDPGSNPIVAILTEHLPPLFVKDEKTKKSP